MKRSNQRIVWLFGNPDLAQDSLPLQLKDRLVAAFPSVQFEEKDPLDEWGKIPDPLIIIDTVKGIEVVTIFHSIDEFQRAPNVTMHDFDLGTQLAFLKKLGKLPKITIIGTPQVAAPSAAFEEIRQVLITICTRA